MPESQFKSLLEAVQSDKDLQERLNAAANLDVVVEIANDAGYAISRLDTLKFAAWLTIRETEEKNREVAALNRAINSQPELLERLSNAADHTEMLEIAEVAGFKLTMTDLARAEAETIGELSDEALEYIVGGNCNENQEQEWRLCETAAMPVFRPIPGGAVDQQRTRGETSLGDITFTRQLDRTSPVLMEACVLGKFTNPIVVDFLG